MDLLRNQLARIQQQLSGLSASQKMLTASLVAIMVMTLLWMGRYAGTAEMVPVLDQPLQSHEIKPILTQLSAGGIEARLIGDRVMVPAARRNDALGLLALEQVLPQDTSKAMLEIAKQINPLSSPTDTSRMWNIGLQSAVEHAIRTSLPGVASAIVIIDPTRVQRVEGSIEPSAMVVVKMRDGSNGNRKLAAAIADMVSGSLASLRRSKVNITIGESSYSIEDRGSTPVASSSDHLEAEMAATRLYEERVRHSLSFIRGDVLVTVHVKVDNISTQTQQNTIDKVDQKEKSIETETFDSTMPINTGAEPGTASNTGLALGTQVTPQEQVTTKDRSRTDFDNFTSETRETRVKPGGAATPVSASVWIPRSHFVNTFNKPDGSADETALKAFIEQELAAVRRHVKIALNLPDDQSVFVDTYFSAAPPLVAAALESPQSMISGSLRGYAKEIAIGGLALISLVMVSMMVRKSGPAPALGTASDLQEQHRLMAGEHLAGEVAAGHGTLDGIELDDETIRAQQVVEQVSTMVRENPDAAANLVKRWLNRS